ncbi:MAG: hypothetical protein ACX94C_10650 [Phycisphaerales bacterium]
MRLLKLAKYRLTHLRSEIEPVRFAIICRGGRTGSNLLVNILNRHGPESVLCHSEVFHSNMIATKGQVSLDVSIEQRDSDPAAFLKLLGQETLASNRWISSYGFKLFMYHNPAAIDYVLRSGTYRMIYLCRENLLAQFSSREIAEHTGFWSSWDGAAGPVKVDFDGERFDQYLDYIEESSAHVEGLLQRSKTQWARVTYKGVVSGDDWDTIAKIIGVDQLRPRKIDLEKQNTNTILDRFANPDDVVAHLERIGHPEWAEE